MNQGSARLLDGATSDASDGPDAPSHPSPSPPPSHPSTPPADAARDSGGTRVPAHERHPPRRPHRRKRAPGCQRQGWPWVHGKGASPGVGLWGGTPMAWPWGEGHAARSILPPPPRFRPTPCCRWLISGSAASSATKPTSGHAPWVAPSTCERAGLGSRGSVFACG